MKRFYAISAMALLALGATAVAQSYHGFSRPFTEEFVTNTKNGTKLTEYWDAEKTSQKVFWLETAYHPDYQFPKSADEPGTWITGTADNSPTEDKLQGKLNDGTYDGAILTPTYNAQMAWVTVPAQYYKGGQLADVPATGTVRFRIAAGGAPNRMGDSYDFHAMDMSGFYFTVCAPAGVTVDAGIVSANGTQDMKDGNGKCYHVPYLEMGAVPAANTPVDMTMEKDNQQWKGATILFTFKRPDKGLENHDAAGFPVKYWDVVFRGVKAGDKLGLGNYQTLHAGYTPVTGVAAGAGASVEEIAIDENAPVEYYNLQGVRVANPENGLYIVRQGSKATKVFLK